MNSTKIGFFTADAVECNWTSLAVVRDRYGTFLSVEVLPDTQVFSESSINNSKFELPAIDIVKKRAYAELRDHSYISILDNKEIVSAPSVTCYLINTRIEGTIWQFVEKQISNYLRTHRLAFVNGTIVTLPLVTGESIQIKIEGNSKIPKWYAFAPNTKITYVQGDRAFDFVEYPTFKSVFERMKRIVNFSLFNAEKAPSLLSVKKNNFKNPHPKGCIFTGADGSGRGFLMRKIADSLNIGFVEIDASTIDSTSVVFEQLNVELPPKTIVLLRNFDMHLNGEPTPFQRRLESQLASLIDNSTQCFFAMAVLSRDTIPNGLQAASRLGTVVTFPPLSKDDIKIILGDKFDQRIVDEAGGYPAGRLIDAARIGVADEIFEGTPLEDSTIKGSVAQTKWEDIGGLSKTKAIVREAVEWPLTRTKELQKFGVKPPRGVLLYGPPGCGKTMIARAIATSLSSSFFSISAASVFQMYLGESERVVRELFELARQRSPAVVFIDEIDAMVGKRGKTTGVAERVLSTFLNEMDGISMMNDVVVVAATNRPDALDEALMRPGRFDCLVEVQPATTKEDVIEVLKVCTRKMPLAEGVAEKASALIPLGSSGAEIDNLCREAALIALYDGAEVVTYDHFEKAAAKGVRR